MDMTSGGIIRPLGGRSGHSHRAEDVNAIPDAIITAIGDLIVGGPDANPKVLTRGPAGHALVSDDTAESGLTYQEVSLPGHEHFYAAPDHSHVGSVPIGGVVPYAGTTAPTGWLVCNGAEVSSSLYPLLAAVCGDAYGVATQTGFFKIPSLQGRFPLGSLPGTYALGDVGGSATVTLSESQIPAHNHAGPSHTHETLPHTHLLGNHTHTTPVHNHTATATVGAESAHTHSAGNLGTTSGGSHTHLGTLAANVVTNVSFLTGESENTGANTRVRSITVTKGKVAIQTTNGTVTNDGGPHSHNVTGTSGAGASHTHTVTVTTGDATSSVTGEAPLSPDSQTVSVNSGGGDSVTGTTGGGQPVDTRPPYVTLNYIIRAE